MAKQTMEGVSLLGVWQREQTASGVESAPESGEFVPLEAVLSDGSAIAWVVRGL
jgi:hypothetical protein